MQQFTNGKYLGQNTFENRFNGLIISQNQYQTGFSSNWHYHENPYFAFILKGGSLERRKEQDVECTPGMLLFYNTREAHKNEEYREGSKNFSIEFERSWFENMNLYQNMFEGGFIIEDFSIKKILLKIMSEAKSNNNEMQLSIESSILQILSTLSGTKSNYTTPPQWLVDLKELLHDAPVQSYSLSGLARFFGVHPVTISKLFPHFFGCTIGEYIREIKIEKSLQLLCKKHISLDTIALECGFADNPHFTRTFKKSKGLSPSQYRSIIFG